MPMTLGDHWRLPLASAAVKNIRYAVLAESPVIGKVVVPTIVDADPLIATTTHQAFCPARICVALGATDPLGSTT